MPFFGFSSFPEFIFRVQERHGEGIKGKSMTVTNCSYAVRLGWRHCGKEKSKKGPQAGSPEAGLQGTFCLGTGWAAGWLRQWSLHPLWLRDNPYASVFSETVQLLKRPDIQQSTGACLGMTAVCGCLRPHVRTPGPHQTPRVVPPVNSSWQKRLGRWQALSLEKACVWRRVCGLPVIPFLFREEENRSLYTQDSESRKTDDKSYMLLIEHSSPTVCMTGVSRIRAFQAKHTSHLQTCQESRFEESRKWLQTDSKIATQSKTLTERLSVLILFLCLCFEMETIYGERDVGNRINGKSNVKGHDH